MLVVPTLLKRFCSTALAETKLWDVVKLLAILIRAILNNFHLGKEWRIVLDQHRGIDIVNDGVQLECSSQIITLHVCRYNASERVVLAFTQ